MTKYFGLTGSVCGAALAVALMPVMAQAQSHQPVLIEQAHFGSIQTVEGAELPIVTAGAGCKTGYQPEAGGPCFDEVALKPAAQGETRVLVVSAMPKDGAQLAGDYGRDYRVYDLFPIAGGVQARVSDMATSDVSVPRDCFALPDEEVTYRIEARKTGQVAIETQTVVCGGGARSPHGPYAPEGPPIASAQTGWPNTKMRELEGETRYLATLSDCDPQYSLKTTYCAQPGVLYLQTHPDVKEIDLIAAKHPVQAGDRLPSSEIDQWVLKRKGTTKFKADSRWIDKSMMRAEDGCWPVEAIGWQVTGEADGLYVHESALNRCGAPMAPVPTEIWEAYGDDLYIVDCSERRDWRKGRSQGTAAAECFDSARDYLLKIGQKRAQVIVLNERARLDDRLYNGSYIHFDVAEVTLNADRSLTVNRLSSDEPSGVYMSNCSTVNDGPPESKGYVIARSMGISWARSYRWMSCPVY
ncbi:MAG: hypothetical protein WBQ60_09890 [Asticcacaulis sp.]